MATVTFVNPIFPLTRGGQLVTLRVAWGEGDTPLASDEECRISFRRYLVDGTGEAGACYSGRPQEPGLVPMPRDVLAGSADDVLYVYPSMPWIDPVREITAWTMAVQAGFASEFEVQRRRGASPRDLLEQVTEWRRMAADKKLVFSSNAATQVPVSTIAGADAAPPDPNPDTAVNGPPGA